jgi:hypothetical protein
VCPFFSRQVSDADVQEQDETDAKAERLEKLASFQLQMIQHAFKCKSHFLLALGRLTDQFRLSKRLSTPHVQSIQKKMNR